LCQDRLHNTSNAGLLLFSRTEKKPPHQLLRQRGLVAAAGPWGFPGGQGRARPTPTPSPEQGAGAAPATRHLPGDHGGRDMGPQARRGPWPGRAGLWGAGARPCCDVTGAGADRGPGPWAGLGRPWGRPDSGSQICQRPQHRDTNSDILTFYPLMQTDTVLKSKSPSAVSDNLH